MRIGFDAKRAFFNKTGLGNYSRNLINALLHFYPEENYQLYSPKEPKLFQKVLQNDNVDLSLPQEGIKAIWRSFGLGRQLAGDTLHVYHGLSNELPFDLKRGNTKSVVTIHDLIYLLHPEWYPAFDRIVYHKKVKWACENADKVIAISQQTKNDIIRFYNIKPDKIEVVYQSCHPRFYNAVSAEDKEKIKERFELPDNYILYVGALSDRKNVLSILKAVKSMTYPLVLVGNGSAYKQTLISFINKHHLQQRVKILSLVHDNELPAIYQMAGIFVYPSVIEGFGIPLLEAMASGVPVVTTAGGCFEEVAQSAAKYIKPTHVSDMAKAIAGLMENDTEREALITLAKKRAAELTEQHFAANIMRVYNSL